MSNNIARVGLEIDGIDGTFFPTGIEVREKLHELRSIEVRLEAGPVETLTDLHRKGAQISVTVDGVLVRRFEGVILSTRRNFGGSRSNAVVLRIGSPLDFLGLSTDCRIFQNLDPISVVKQIFTDAGIPADRVNDRTTRTYNALASLTQYNETMLAFVSRVLEDVGAFFYFEDGDSGLAIVIADSADAHHAMSIDTLPYAPDEGVNRGPHVAMIGSYQSTRPTKVTVRDLDWNAPTTDLTASTSSTQALPLALEHYDYPGGYANQADGVTRSSAMMDAFVAANVGVRFFGNTPAVQAGSTFTLTDAAIDALNQAYVVTEAVHEWSARSDVRDSWTVSFRTLPKTLPFRPLKKTPKPVIRGPQTAFVTGPSGQEINTEAQSRVHLKFHWDRRSKNDETSSAWARVAHEQMTGAVAIPRIGWEVLVEFEHGDPDRPIVVGRLNNATYVPPYTLPDDKTRSSIGSYTSPGGAGHNEIRLEDLKGSEHVHMHAQKDHLLTVANDRTTAITTSRMVTIKADEQVTVKGNRSFTVKGMYETTIAGSQTHTVQGTRDKTVTTDEMITVNGARSTSITKGHTISTSASATIGTEGNVTSAITGDLSEESSSADQSIVVGDDMSLTIGASKTETATKGKTVTTEGDRKITVGAGMTDTSTADFGLQVGGKRASTVGAAWSVTSAGDFIMSSDGDMAMTIGAAMSVTAAAGITFKCGGSKITIGGGGVTIEASKITVKSDGPAMLTAAVIASK